MNPRDWEETPACAGSTALFFTTGSENYQVTSAWVIEAKKLCALCPVLAECRQWNDGVEADTPYVRLDGIYAGETPMERWTRRQGATSNTHCRRGHPRSGRVDKLGRPYCEQCRTRADQGYCRRGHALTPETTYVTSQGYRGCVECRRRTRARYDQTRKAVAA